MDFSLSTQVVGIGQPITVRWTTQSAHHIVLSTAIGWDLNDPTTGAFNQEVELSGSRTFIARRGGRVYFELNVDDGLIDQLLWVVPQ